MPVAIRIQPMMVSCALWMVERNCSPTTMITAPRMIETRTCAIPASPDSRATRESG